MRERAPGLQVVLHGNYDVLRQGCIIRDGPMI